MSTIWALSPNLKQLHAACGLFCVKMTVLDSH